MKQKTELIMKYKLKFKNDYKKINGTYRPPYYIVQRFYVLASLKVSSNTRGGVFYVILSYA